MINLLFHFQVFCSFATCWRCQKRITQYVTYCPWWGLDPLEERRGWRGTRERERKERKRRGRSKRQSSAERIWPHQPLTAVFVWLSDRYTLAFSLSLSRPEREREREPERHARIHILSSYVQYWRRPPKTKPFIPNENINCAVIKLYASDIIISSEWWPLEIWHLHLVLVQLHPQLAVTRLVKLHLNSLLYFISFLSSSKVQWVQLVSSKRETFVRTTASSTHPSIYAGLHWVYTQHNDGTRSCKSKK